jgi:SAM-dependent methyltransferase
MHAIPLARLGFAVTAIDTSPHLLTELRNLGAGLRIHTIEDDLLNFTAHLVRKPDLILCMGDTLTHLSSLSDVELLCAKIGESLAPYGRFVAAFRDYTHLPSGDARFIPVRSDTKRIHTCFLEGEQDRVLVHDLVHELQDDVWALRVSHYQKLRLPPDFVTRSLEEHGLDVVNGKGPRGMVQIEALRRN